MGCMFNAAITSGAFLVVHPNMRMHPLRQPILLHGRWTSGVVGDHVNRSKTFGHEDACQYKALDHHTWLKVLLQFIAARRKPSICLAGRLEE